MQAAYITISIIIVIASVLLTLVVLVQNSKGGGLAANFAAGNQTFGVRQTADFLEKLTWGLAITILILCVVATFVIPTKGAHHSQVKEKIEQTAPVQGQPEFPTNTAPATTPTPSN
ncbi:MAG: preprotein translocase subunit SecG [Bacteroidales bacterium]|nr:preprotein translocase subunit SecG [Bacteroidales bacterium]MDD4670581.1 preprotein translocase subunit SecG [Bacteroidales bacterium]